MEEKYELVTKFKCTNPNAKECAIIKQFGKMHAIACVGDPNNPRTIGCGWCKLEEDES